MYSRKKKKKNIQGETNFVRNSNANLWKRFLDSYEINPIKGEF